MNRRILALLTIAAVVAGSTITAAAPALAATSKDFVPQTIFAPRLVTEPGEPQTPQNVVPVGSVDLQMAAGQTAWVLSVMHVNNATQRSLFDNEIICKLPDGTSKNAVIGQNVYEKTNPATQWTDVNLATRYLVQSPTAGTVTCTANVRAHSLDEAAATFQLVGGKLWFADTNVANATDGKPLQQSLPYGPVAKVDSANTARVPALDTFDLPAGFKTLSVFGETQYQICHTTEPATACNRQGASTARFTLIINQWKDNGDPCQTSAGTTVVKTYPYYVHHAYVPLNKGDFAISTAPGCIPRFNAYVRVDWISGETGGVQGTARGLNDTYEGTTTHRSDMSHVFVVPLH